MRLLFPKGPGFPNCWNLLKPLSTHSCSFVPVYRLPRLLSDKESTCQCRGNRKLAFDSWVRHISWRRKWELDPVFFTGKSHEQRSLVVCKGPVGLQSVTWLSESTVQHIPRYSVQFSSVQSLSRVWLFATPLITAHQASLSITSSQSLLKLMPIESVMPSSHLILCCPLLLLPPTTPSMRVFSNKSTLHMRWPKYWSFSFSISPYNEHPGLISFRMNWLDLLTVQGTLKSLLQNHSSKASIFQHSAFFTVQLTSMHDHWKNHSLDQTELCWQINVSAF